AYTIINTRVSSNFKRHIMPKLNIFIDGTWLFRVCQPDGVLSNRTEYNTQSFKLNFDNLTNSLIGYLKSKSKNVELGERYISTSIFDLPSDLANWTNENPDVTTNDIERVTKGAQAREFMVQNALAAGFSDSAVYRPRLRPFMIEKLKNKTYQEKQVDATVIALLVRSAITQGENFHAFITGDSDVLPAIRVAYPEYSKNVLLVTTHPDELRAEHRQTSFSYTDFQFEIEPYFLQDHVKEIIHGQNVYECSNCRKTFVRSKSIPKNRRPYCNNCSQGRT
ncbi:MAG: hypothetical protein WBP45_09600, partial [Daejeonella sp.]